jgi:beta-phosphoglucomutase
MRSVPPVRAMLFDMDGTIVDNMRFHDDAWEAWHLRHGLAFERDSFFARTAGRTNAEIFADGLGSLPAARIAELSDEKEALYRERYAPHRRTLAGFDALAARARADGIRLAVSTAAPPANIAFVLDGLGLRPLFDTVTCPADGLRGKPHPDLYSEAARRLGVDPQECLVFEDAPLGVEAARRAGMRCVALTTSLAATHFGAFDNLVAVTPDFTGLAERLLPAPPRTSDRP